MTEISSKIIPNSFQTPNFFVDACLAYLSGNEYKCLSFLARKTFGWQKRSDRISKPQLIEATGLNSETLDGCMNFLIAVGLVIRVHENNAYNEGIEWALQLDDQQVRFDLLQQRKTEQAELQQKRTQKARAAIANKRGGLSNNHTPEERSVGQKTAGGGIVGQSGGGIVQQSGGGSVGQYTQKPIKTKEKNMGADAPARASSSSPEDRIQDFPQTCQEGARLMFEIFRLLPPERPAPDSKGGDFALWINGIKALNQIAKDYNLPLEQAMRLAYAHWNRSPFNLAHPGALKKVMASAIAQAISQTGNSSTTVTTPLADQLKTFKPRGSA